MSGSTPQEPEGPPPLFISIKSSSPSVSAGQTQSQLNRSRQSEEEIRGVGKQPFLLIPPGEGKHTLLPARRLPFQAVGMAPSQAWTTQLTPGAKQAGAWSGFTPGTSGQPHPSQATSASSPALHPPTQEKARKTLISTTFIMGWFSYSLSRCSRLWADWFLDLLINVIVTAN